MSEIVSSRSRPASHPVFVRSADVAVVMLAIDARMRPLAESLEPYRMHLDGESWIAPAEALGAIAEKLYELRAGWSLAGAYSSPRTDGEIAEASYLGIVRELAERALRGRSSAEPQTSGGVYRDGAPSTRRLFVVCLIVAANATLPDVSRGADAQQIGSLLLMLRSLSGELAAALVIAPDATAEPWDAEHVRRRFPELKHVDEATLEPRTRCRACDAPVLKAFGACQVCGRRIDAG
ncbi:MAG: hypothetical protein IT379_31055 [Deltaproteobacteria bacterium]|nr:hypothetical protein [Deltaproteobacteria bacterium]